MEQTRVSCDPAEKSQSRKLNRWINICSCITLLIKSAIRKVNSVFLPSEEQMPFEVPGVFDLLNALFWSATDVMTKIRSQSRECG